MPPWFLVKLQLEIAYIELLFLFFFKNLYLITYSLLLLYLNSYIMPAVFVRQSPLEIAILGIFCFILINYTAKLFIIKQNFIEKCILLIENH